MSDCSLRDEGSRLRIVFPDSASGYSIPGIVLSEACVVRMKSTEDNVSYVIYCGSTRNAKQHACQPITGVGNHR